MDDERLLSYLEDFITPERKARFIEVLEQRTKFITVAIEDVFQLHNTSAVIRSCEVFGIQEAHVIENRFGKRLDKNIAMGAQQWVDMHGYKNTTDCIQNLRQNGYKIVATTPKENACAVEDFNLSEKTALFLAPKKKDLAKKF